MTAPTVTVSMELNEIVAGEFVVGTSLVGGTDVIGDGLSQVESSVTRCSIRRGRWGALYEDFEAATIVLTFNNEDRLFDPVHAAGDYYGELVPGRNVQVAANGIPIVTGYVEDYDLEYDVSGRSVTVLKGTDALGRFGALQFNAWTSEGGSAPSKLDDVCDRSEVAWSSWRRDFIGSSRDVSVGRANSGLQADAVSWGSNVLNYMRLIARSDWFSFLFASADGLLKLRPVFAWTSRDNEWTPGVLTDAGGVPLRDDDANLLSGSVASFGGVNIPYQTIRAQYGSETLFSEVSLDAENATQQTATVADVSVWQATYGPSRRLSVTGLLVNKVFTTIEDELETFAEDLLEYYETPSFRITEISVQLAGLSSTDQDTVLAIDIADPVDVSFTPNNVGSAIEQTLVVQGIGHDIAPMSHVVTFALIDYLATA